MAFLFQRKIKLKNGLKSKVWYIGWYDKSPAGCLIRRNLSTKEKSKLKANLKLAAFISNRESVLQPRRILMSDFANKYLEVTAKSRGEKTNGNIEYIFIKTIEVLGDRYLDNYTAECFDSFFTDLLNSGLSKYTVKNYRSSLRAGYQQALRWDYVQLNVVDKTRHIKPEEPDIIPFARDEFAKLLSVINNPLHYDIIVFTLYTGLRVGDIVNIKLSDIILDKKIIRITSGSEHRPKNQRTNYVEIADAIIPIVQHSLLSNQNYLFEKVNHFKYSSHTISNVFKRYVSRAGINPALNHKSLRKTFASWLVNEGVPVEEISKLLHHSSPAVTRKHYAKILTPKSTGITNLIYF